jgi:hypothetical protein
MVNREAPVAYVIFGSYVCPPCAKNISGFSRHPVYGKDLPKIVWCRGCENRIEVPVKAGNVQDDAAYRIRAELVCCNIYERVRRDALEIDKSREPVDPADKPSSEPTSFGIQGAMGRAILRRDWHDLCYWGEAAARIAEGRCPGYETTPNICRCTCEGCKSNCSAHKEEK